MTTPLSDTLESVERSSSDHEKIAIFSDIHSNLPALEAVLKECRKREIRGYICLGDIVGYGGQPAECLQIVRELGCPAIMGNHDEAVSRGYASEDTNDSAVAGIEYSIKQLSEDSRQWLGALPESLQKKKASFVHASLMEPAAWCYIFSEADAALSFIYQTTPLCFCGHTHLPRVFVRRGTRQPVQIDENTYKFSAEGSALVNVGSVGQPRNRDPRAQFAIYDPVLMQVELVQVEYNISAACSAILKAKLPENLATRLIAGV